MKKIAIIGLGLIGSSIARCLKKSGKYTIVGFDNNPEYTKQAINLKICHNVFDTLNDTVVNADIVLLSTPVSSFKQIITATKNSLKTGAIITDVGSVKQKVIDDLINIIPDNCSFVPAHPISGTEKSGPSAGFSELFENRFTIICPTPKSDDKALATIKQMWIDLGAKVDIVEPKHHDLALAMTSHIPHFLAYVLVGTAQNLENSLNGEITHKEVIKYSAGGFRDATRVAGSDPTMWRDIFLANKQPISEIVELFIADLKKLQSAMENNDSEFIFDLLSKTRAIRREVIEAGQADYTDPFDEKDSVSLMPYSQD